jgi:hypothetical protein
MKRRGLALALTVAVLVSLVVDVVEANPFMPSGSWSNEPIPPSISVQSPSEKLNYWTGSDVWLDFTVTVPLTRWYSSSNEGVATIFGTVTQVRFSLDGKAEIIADKVSEDRGVLSFSVDLERLIAGQHAIKISAEGSGYYGNLTHDIYLGSNHTIQESAKTKFVQSSLNISFSVDGVRPTEPPNITLLSPANTTYYYILDWTSIPYVLLTYKAEDKRLSAGYSLDGGNIIPVMNGSKIDIPIESRSLTLYANDSFGNSATPQTVYYKIMRDPRSKGTSPFSGARPPTSSAPFPASLAFVTAAGIAIVAVILFAYFKKRRHG